MREGWKTLRLGSVTRRVIEPVAVQDDRLYANLGVKWYAAGTFLREPRAGSEIKAKTLFRVRPGQFVYNRLFATEGSFALIRPEDAEAVASNEFPVFEVDSSELAPEYLYLHFQQPSVWEEVNRQCTGTTKSRLRWKEELFGASPLAIPPLSEQRRIVDLVRAFDDAIASTRNQRVAAAHVREQFREYLCRGDAEVKVGAVLHAVSRPAQVDAECAYEEIGIRSHGKGTFDKAPVLGADLGTKKVFWMVPGALAFNIVFAWEGAVALIGENATGKVASHRFPNYISPLEAGERFMAEYFRTRTGIELLASCSPGGAGRNKTLNRAALLASEIRVVAPGEWPAVVALLDDAATAEQRATLLLDRLTNIRSNILTTLMSGEHEIPQSYDELMGEAS